MPRRKLILHILLWSLGLAAIAGAAAVLLPVADVVERVMLTGLATGVAAGLALPVSLLLERSTGRHAGLLGMCIIVGEFFIALVLIWFERQLSSRPEEQLGLTMLFVALTGGPAMVSLWLAQTQRGRIAGLTGAVVAVITFVLFMIAIIAPSRWVFEDDWAGTAATIGMTGILAVLILIGAGTGNRRAMPALALTALGVAAAVTFAGLVIVDIWDVADISEETITVAISLAVLAAHTSIIWLIPLDPKQSRVRWGTTAFASVTAALIILLVLTDQNLLDDTLGRLTAAAGIVTACGTMALLVFVAMNRRAAIEHRASLLATMTIICPHCHRKQEAPLGRSACETCGLRMEIRVEEPRCPQCSYLLYRITSDRCPECGTAIGAQR